MSAAIDAARRETLEAFGAAWSSGDIDTMLRLMTDDCIYGASLGPEPGKTYQGQTEVRAGILAMIAHDRAERTEVINLFIAGDKAAWEWRYFQRDKNGNESLTHGCDLFYFVGDKISLKQTFRKVDNS